MKKLLLLTILSIKIFAIDSFSVKNLILEKKELEIKKTKYIEENYSLSKVELLNFDIQILEKELELEKTINDYNKEKIEIKLLIDSGNGLIDFYEKKENFFKTYLNTMKKNKNKFSQLDILEIELIIQEIESDKKEFLLKLENSRKNLSEFYNGEFKRNLGNYEKWLEEKTKFYENQIIIKKSLLEIAGESKINKDLNDINSKKTNNVLENERKNLETKKTKLIKSKELLTYKIKNIDAKMEAYKLKAEKKDKEQNLGLITQKEYFDFYNEYFNVELNKKELENQLKLLELELEL